MINLVLHDYRDVCMFTAVHSCILDSSFYNVYSNSDSDNKGQYWMYIMVQNTMLSAFCAISFNCHNKHIVRFKSVPQSRFIAWSSFITNSGIVF